MSDDLTTMRLSHGAHDTREEGVCLLEAVAWLAGERHSDRPACASLVLAEYGRALNDAILASRADLEPRLRALAPRLVGTAGRLDLDQLAGLLAADWLIRVYAPAWLRLAGLSDHADALAGADPIRSWDKLPIPQLQAAYRAAAYSAAYSAALNAAVNAAVSAAESTAESAAESTAESAAWSAARSAAWSAARSAAYSAADSAAWGAAYSAAGNAAYSAARSAAWSAAVSAAYSAAKGAAEDAAEDAAESLARNALAPTVRELQDSALDLYERMIALWEVVDLDALDHGDPR